MDGFFQEGDTIHAIWMQYHSDVGGSGDAVGSANGVDRIVIEKSAGPMGWYAVAVAYRDDVPFRAYPVHMAETIVIENPAEDTPND